MLWLKLGALLDHPSGTKVVVYKKHFGCEIGPMGGCLEVSIGFLKTPDSSGILARVWVWCTFG